MLQWAQLPITLEEWTAKVDAQRELFRRSQPLPGVPELLAKLAWQTAPPVKLALASSASRPNFTLKTSHLPAITKAFPQDHCIFGSDDAMRGKRKKPAPDIFMLALQLLNERLEEGEREVAPDECLVFEDSIAGVEAGRQAGMRVIWVPHKGLREFCRGKESDVLEETTEQDEDGKGYSTKTALKVSNGSLWSSDRRAQLLDSLEDFSYSLYDIEMKRSDGERDNPSH